MSYLLIGIILLYGGYSINSLITKGDNTEEGK